MLNPNMCHPLFSKYHFICLYILLNEKKPRFIQIANVMDHQAVPTPRL